MITIVSEINTKNEFDSYKKLSIDNEYIPYIKVYMEVQEWDNFDMNLINLDGSPIQKDSIICDFVQTPNFKTYTELNNFLKDLINILQNNGYLIKKGDIHV